MKPKKHLTPHAAEAAAPKPALLPGEATAAKFKLLSKADVETDRNGAYAYLRVDDIVNGRV